VQPLLILADTSGSMAQEGKISALNRGLRELVAGCAARAEPVEIAVIAFADEARLALPFTPAAAVAWIDLVAGGGTRLAPAFAMAAHLLSALPGADTMRPLLVLVSDGYPADRDGDRLPDSLQRIAADRAALAIGPDADIEMLARFVDPDHRGDPRARVLEAGSEQEILRFFSGLPRRLDDVGPAAAEEMPRPTAPMLE
jgi:uncharacterized protein YegL